MRAPFSKGVQVGHIFRRSATACRLLSGPEVHRDDAADAGRDGTIDAISRTRPCASERCGAVVQSRNDSVGVGALDKSSLEKK